MIKKLLCISILLGCFIMMPSLRSSQRFTVMTQNALFEPWYMVRTPGKPDPNGIRRWHNMLAVFEDILKKAAISTYIALQEYDQRVAGQKHAAIDFAFNVLKKTIGGVQIYVPTAQQQRYSGARVKPNEIFPGLAWIGKSSWKATSFFRNFSTPGGDKSGKGFYILDIVPTGKNVPSTNHITLLNVHLVGGAGPANDYAGFRYKQMQEIINYVVTQSKRPGYVYWVICGDFNTDSLTNKAIYTKMLADLNEGLRRAGSVIQFADAYAHARSNDPSIQEVSAYNLENIKKGKSPLENIDYIWYSTNSLVLENVLSAQNVIAQVTADTAIGAEHFLLTQDPVLDAHRTWFSDHLLLSATFALKEPVKPHIPAAILAHPKAAVPPLAKMVVAAQRQRRPAVATPPSTRISAPVSAARSVLAGRAARGQRPVSRNVPSAGSKERGSVAPAKPLARRSPTQPSSQTARNVSITPSPRQIPRSPIPHRAKPTEPTVPGKRATRGATTPLPAMRPKVPSIAPRVAVAPRTVQRSAAAPGRKTIVPASRGTSGAIPAGTSRSRVQAVPVRPAASGIPASRLIQAGSDTAAQKLKKVPARPPLRRGTLRR